MASRTSRREWVRGFPWAFGVGRYDRKQIHSVSERSVGYSFLIGDSVQNHPNLHLYQTGSKTYYDILEVDPSATAEEIKESRRLLRAAWHPDKFKGNNKNRAEEKFKDIEQAYEVLGNPQKRVEYDRYLAHQHSAKANQQQTAEQRRREEERRQRESQRQADE